MGSRRTGGGVENVYKAAELWVERALRADDSLFTPGNPIWSQRWLSELRECYLNQPDTSKRNFYVKLADQLAGRPREVYQLMGEVLYAHFLIIGHGRGGMRRDSKVERIDRVFEWSNQEIAIPENLVAGLTPGIANMSQSRSRYLPFMVGFFIEFVDHWKEIEPSDHQRLLANHWAFREFATQLDLRGLLFRESTNAHRPQREAMLHLVFPDTFEGIVNVEDKNKIANAFSRLATGSTEDVDRKLQDIRPFLETKYGEDFAFHDIKDLWQPSPPLQPEIDRLINELLTLPPPPPNDLPALANELWLDADFLENIQTLLEDKKQVIFQGPPGTGKTYVAQKLAERLAGSKERVTLVQFHPSYAYEDFVQGFRPKTTDDGQPGFELRDGPLLRAAERAGQEPNANHYLVIDEINRGNLAKVFGELYFLLEYRDKEMDLQYSDEPFSLPGNLYIIGTMNTADRSIAMVDLALRRRFYFVEFHPDDDPVKSVLRNWLLDKAPDMEWVADVIERANDHLREDRHAAIGPSYFMKDGLNNDMVVRIWKHSVLPYIEERLYGQQEEVDKFKLDRLQAELI